MVSSFPKYPSHQQREIPLWSPDGPLLQGAISFFSNTRHLSLYQWVEGLLVAESLDQVLDCRSAGLQQRDTRFPLPWASYTIILQLPRENRPQLQQSRSCSLALISQTAVLSAGCSLSAGLQLYQSGCSVVSQTAASSARLLPHQPDCSLSARLRPNQPDCSLSAGLQPRQADSSRISQTAASKPVCSLVSQTAASSVGLQSHQPECCCIRQIVASHARSTYGPILIVFLSASASVST
jgi:hypothetical protein